MSTVIEVTQRRGLSHKPEAHRLIIKGLGLRRIGHTVTLHDTPAIRGMVEKVQYMLDVTVKNGTPPPKRPRRRIKK
jgi:large subunit ribosomal protein L30